ncbi:MAG: glycosyltransferase family 9 protein [Fibrobacteria bacterium]|nr:glycosyltransferase family 9 protein [Fibrobacteria bacterium]
MDLELYHGYPIILKSLLHISFSKGFRVESTYTKNHNQTVIRSKNKPEWQCFYKLFEVAFDTNTIPTPVYQETGGEGPINSKIGVVLGASFNWPQKQWPLDFYRETMQTLANKGFEFIIFGLEYERNMAEELKTTVTAKIENTAGQLNFSRLKTTIKQCRLIFGNDTGTMHLAAACGIPTVTIFGPTNEKKWNADTSLPVFSDINCRPCYYLSSMPNCSHRNCLVKLTPDRVIEAIISQIKYSSPND